MATEGVFLYSEQTRLKRNILFRFWFDCFWALSMTSLITWLLQTTENKPFSLFGLFALLFTLFGVSLKRCLFECANCALFAKKKRTLILMYYASTLSLLEHNKHKQSKHNVPYSLDEWIATTSGCIHTNHYHNVPYSLGDKNVNRRVLRGIREPVQTVPQLKNSFHFIQQ